MRTPQTIVTHAYRAATIQRYCCVCQQQATHVCPACGHTFCLEHTTFVERCPDCDVRLSRQEERAVRMAGLALVTGLALGAALLVTESLALSAIPAVGAVLAMLGGVLACSSAALWMLRQRRRFDHGPPGPRLLQDASVPIAPDPLSTGPRLERSEGYQSRASASLPDIWRTSWGG